MHKKRFATREIILSGLFCGLMIVGANLRIQFPMVPLTFQPFFAILSGLLLGSTLGVLSQTAYLLLGLMGLPVFASGGGGFLYATKPTFGFILGFVLAAYLAGKCIGTGNRPPFRRILLASLSGLAGIYLIGILYMYGIQTLYLAKSVSLLTITKGMLLFLLKDAVLFVAASALAYRIIPVLRRGTR